MRIFRLFFFIFSLYREQQGKYEVVDAEYESNGNDDTDGYSDTTSYVPPNYSTHSSFFTNSYLGGE